MYILIVGKQGWIAEVSARCYSVYPSTGSDNYTFLQVVVTDTSGNVMSEIVKLNENASSVNFIKLKEAYSKERNIRFAFRGNSPKHSAYAHVFYNAR